MAKLILLIPVFVGLSLITGCGHNDSADDKNLRSAFTNPPPFDIQKVPPEKRAMVEALIEQSKKAKAGVSVTGTPPSQGK